MRRRELIGLLGGMAAIWPLTTLAEQPKGMRKLGVLMVVAEDDPISKARIAAFQQGLQEFGWQDGQNIHIQYRWGAGRPELIRQYAQELVALAPELIVANGTPAILALKPLTRTIPIVCALVTDPVGLGFVDSLSHPGGNITGFSFFDPELIGKWTGLLKEAAPSVNRATVLYNPKMNPWYRKVLRELAATPQAAAMEVVPAPVETVDQLRTAIAALAKTQGGSLMIGPEAFVLSHIREVAQLAAQNRLPGVSVYRQFVAEGGLMSYGPDIPDIFRRAAGYVDRILKGATPADLPVQQPTKFEFIVNQKAGAALGFTLSSTLLSLADEVIE